jgi:hypothetical protein
MSGEHAHPAEFSSMMKGFSVVDRNGEAIGKVRDVNVGRTCVLVEEGRSLLGRKHRHALHVATVKEVDLDAFTISVAVARDDVRDAPEFHQLAAASELAIARYYYDRLEALGEKPYASV